MIKQYEHGMSSIIDYLVMKTFKSYDNGSTKIIGNPRNVSFFDDNESFCLVGKQKANIPFGRLYFAIFDAETKIIYVKFFKDKEEKELQPMVDSLERNLRLCTTEEFSKIILPKHIDDSFLIWKTRM